MASITRGGPGNAADILGTYLYQESFSELRWGYGSAVEAGRIDGLNEFTLLVRVALPILRGPDPGHRHG